MIVKYLFSYPDGDIPITPEDLNTPFKISPKKNHPSLTLRDYFEAIQEFLFKEQRSPLNTLLADHSGQRISLDHIDKVLIRSEKHGALYHLASAEIFSGNRSLKYAVSTAVSENGKACLNHEYDLLQSLGKSFNLPYLPTVYFKGEIIGHPGVKKEPLSMFLAEWFADYHEWHLSMDEKDKKQNVCLWDQKRGHRFASIEESFEIYKQASKILTLYYDTRNSRQIYPWHHAAGDFVVKTEEGSVDVKLTTARGYEPIVTSLKELDVNRFIAIIYFFLNMTIKMRVDKLDGVGEAVWAKDLSLEAIKEGFWEGLLIMEMEGGYHLGKTDELFSLLRSFKEEELFKLFHPLLEFYRLESSEDYSLIIRNLDEHTARLYQVIQRPPG